MARWYSLYCTFIEPDSSENEDKMADILNSVQCPSCWGAFYAGFSVYAANLFRYDDDVEFILNQLRSIDLSPQGRNGSIRAELRIDYHTVAQYLFAEGGVTELPPDESDEEEESDDNG